MVSVTAQCRILDIGSPEYGAMADDFVYRMCVIIGGLVPVVLIGAVVLIK